MMQSILRKRVNKTAKTYTPNNYGVNCYGSVKTDIIDSVT